MDMRRKFFLQEMKNVAASAARDMSLNTAVSKTGSNTVLMTAKGPWEGMMDVVAALTNIMLESIGDDAADDDDEAATSMAVVAVVVVVAVVAASATSTNNVSTEETASTAVTISVATTSKTVPTIFTLFWCCRWI